ncbi:hypothetical protein CFC21_027416 [Triticum aestivum]|uniref:KIB1-4 beta-propeller domain-containing protein n=3 Tax=Triticinae TaxID=1648030 RepID=A0A3B6D533_WHEAT|nr:hypothetical protein CFC21_027416 [Triticum aestivum]
MEPAICQPFCGFIPGADDGGHESIIPMTDEGNWDDLPHDLVSKVAEFLLRSDVTEFVRLTTVKPWRDAVTAPKLMGMNPRFFPRHWKMLQIQGEQARFVNVLTGASIRVKIPREHGEVIASAEGCLLLASGMHKVRMFNPVTGAAADLPTPFFWMRANGVKITGDIKAAGIIYDGEGEDDAVPTPTMVLLVAVFPIDMVKYARPGDAVWQWRYFAPNEDGELPLFDGEGGLSLGGRFYVPSLTGDVLKLELEPQPHLVYAARQEATQASQLYLHVRSYLMPSVDAGMLLVVRRFENHAGHAVAASHVFQVNLIEGTLTLLQDQKDIANRSIFHRRLTLGTQ